VMICEIRQAHRKIKRRFAFLNRLINK
jgi:hypothetical protein